MSRGFFASFAFGVLAVLVPAAAVVAYSSWRSSSRISRGEEDKDKNKGKDKPRRVLILYGTVTGTAKKFAYRVERHVQRYHGKDSVTTLVKNVAEFAEETLPSEDTVLFLCSTWTDGTAPESASAFLDHLQEYAFDFRVSKDHLAALRFSVFGLGGAVYGDNYAKAARDAHEYLTRLGATPLLPVPLPVRCGDDQTDLEAAFEAWSAEVVPLLGPGGAGAGAGAVGAGSAVPESLAAAVRNQPSSQRPPRRASATPRGSAFQRQQLELKKGIAPSSLASAAAATAAANATATATAAASGAATAAAAAAAAAATTAAPSGANGEDEEDEEEEEDRINDAFVTMDVDAPDVSAGAGAGTGAGAGADSDSDVDSAEGDEGEDEGEGEGEGGEEGGDPHGAVVDLEDMGAVMAQSQAQQAQAQAGGPAREMVTKLQRRALTKEGYRIIGSHSAVKLCRWTKAQMRGRGGCYKHSFYGITSYQCMEATPSLACANKCTFCWRHHKNPVGTEWRWKEDEPGHIVEEAVLLHQAMINEMKGVPGVVPERLREAMRVRHCALSLVGEPIMYPRINDLLRQLHDRQISSFMVTNAQFPDRIRQLDPVTQLYVSVDASTRDSLKAIDRPLFRDFWERFLGSLREMRLKQQRTVFRMTLVKGQNMGGEDENDAELAGYAELVELGCPDFIEIKAVTFCGKSDASDLTMQNVPWHREVCEYGERLARLLRTRGLAESAYSIATEHEHSCCILLAREDKFLVAGDASGDRQWHTWINYPRFDELVQEYYASGGTKTFCSTDYYAPTPEWALYKSSSRGFDPAESRFRKNRAGGLVESQYKSSESGCG